VNPSKKCFTNIFWTLYPYFPDIFRIIEQLYVAAIVEDVKKYKRQSTAYMEGTAGQ
jgi:hypothetical protein